MTSLVTGRMVKVRHNGLNQSECLPPLRPPISNNDAFVWGCTPLVCSQTHTQANVGHPTLSQMVTQKEAGGGEQRVNPAGVEL